MSVEYRGGHGVRGVLWSMQSTTEYVEYAEWLAVPGVLWSGVECGGVPWSAVESVESVESVEYLEHCVVLWCTLE